MRFLPTEIEGALVIEPERIEDERGYFARQWGSDELAREGLVSHTAQVSLSFNKLKHTLRGMHHAVGETKVVHCVRGAIFDVLVDLRPGPTQAVWVGVELTAANHRMVYVPEGVAHGFLTLEDASEVQYLISAPYVAANARGVRFDDPAFAITWPAAPAVIAQRDASYADWVP